MVTSTRSILSAVHKESSEEDLNEQAYWFRVQARKLHYFGVDDMLKRDEAMFMRLAERWRLDHPG